MRSALSRRATPVVVAVVLGIIAGTGLASAHNYFFNAVSGSAFYPGWHTEPDSWPFGLPAHYHYQNPSLTANASYPNATSISVNALHLTAAYSTQDGNPWFGNIYIYDELGNHSQMFVNSRCLKFKPSAPNYSVYPSWSYSGFTPSNDVMIFDQEVWGESAYVGDYCVDPSLAISHKHVIEAR